MSVLTKSLFEFLGLPERFEVEPERVSDAYRRVQAAVHPDRFAAAGQTERRIAMQLASRANEAFQTLSEPLARARYLCELRGLDVEAESNTAMPPEFLMAQMSWRETLDEVREDGNPEALLELRAQVDAHRQSIHERLAGLLDRNEDGDPAAEVRKLMFIERFRQELAVAQRALGA
ncbi:MAG: Fe-S protein assembly co-chaperone HscB [Burkholderiaceae bacterium]